LLRKFIISGALFSGGRNDRSVAVPATAKQLSIINYQSVPLIYYIKSRIGDFVTVFFVFCTFFEKKLKKDVTNPAMTGLYIMKDQSGFAVLRRD
jgi:hypothetical protein